MELSKQTHRASSREGGESGHALARAMCAMASWIPTVAGATPAEPPTFCALVARNAALPKVYAGEQVKTAADYCFTGFPPLKMMVTAVTAAKLATLDKAAFQMGWFAGAFDDGFGQPGVSKETIAPYVDQLMAAANMSDARLGHGEIKAIFGEECEERALALDAALGEAAQEAAEAGGTAEDKAATVKALMGATEGESAGDASSSSSDDDDGKADPDVKNAMKTGDVVFLNQKKKVTAGTKECENKISFGSKATGKRKAKAKGDKKKKKSRN